MIIPTKSIQRSGFSALLSLLLAVGFVQSPATAQESDNPPAVATGTFNVASVVIDGNVLFVVRGISAVPAEVRARDFEGRIIDLARDESFDPASLEVVEETEPSASVVRRGERRLFSVLDFDAELEGIDRHVLADAWLFKIREAIVGYRNDRSREVLLERTTYAAGVTLAMFLLLWANIRLFRWLNKWVKRHVQKSLQGLASKSHYVIRPSHLWRVFGGFLRLVKALSILVLMYFYLNGVLGLYPWTRGLARALFDLIMTPLQSIATGLLAAIPDLIFLAVLYLLTRYLISATKLFFEGIEVGRIKLEKFDADWAMPTYKILRVLIIAFALVLAYPYIPGSDSLAFKGVSVFIGVILSLGSSSFISNMIAGLTMTYRGAFKEGNRVRIGDVTGVVEEIKLMTTRIRTPKNEDVVLPNSNILNNNVVNYSSLAKEDGIVLYTIVGIGYDTPWRQVEAMLLLAADKTEGLMKEPRPFVLQKSLGDYAINYELNAYCDDENQMLQLYSDMHANIQDVFNENGVQIMSPAYVADTTQPKVVPPGQWYEAPAKGLKKES